MRLEDHCNTLTGIRLKKSLSGDLRCPKPLSFHIHGIRYIAQLYANMTDFLLKYKKFTVIFTICSQYTCNKPQNPVYYP